MEDVLEQELSPEELHRMGPDRLMVRVRSIVYQGENINAYELVDPAGGLLPSFEPGSHIDLYFRDRRVRQYSMCGDPRDRTKYVCAVQREPQGRGGSKAIFERVHVGRILAISKPRNNFPLHKEAKRHVLLAGGIGITPMISMIHWLQASGQPFVLHYCTRTPERTAFLGELRPLVERKLAFIYHDEGVPGRGLEITQLLSAWEEGTHLYYCGPNGFMSAVRKAAAHWPTGAVHYEYFAPSPDALESMTAVEPVRTSDMAEAIGVGFQVKLVRSGRVFDVPNDKSIVEVLRENGVEVQTSCESGLCGTCRTRYLDGVPDHRDYILSQQEKARDMLICCSRAHSQMIVLDL